MTLTSILLGAGWLIFVIAGLSWFLFQLLREEVTRRPTFPRRNALYFLLFTIGSFVWLTFLIYSSPIGLSSDLGIEDLLCVLILVPVIAFSSFMVYLAGRRRNRILESQKPNKPIANKEIE